ncbi:MAG: pectate lyase, partial [Treponema sp.]|nr:pectate lyase [Candidatus Treponema equifaecale]
MRFFVFFICVFLTVFGGCASSNNTDGPETGTQLNPQSDFTKLVQQEYSDISISDFSDGFNHARYQYKDSIPPYELYDTTQILGFAENMVYLQNPDGGWAKNLDFQRVYSLSELESIKEKNKSVPPVTYELHSTSNGSTMDNRNIHSQIKYLCQVYKQVKNSENVDGNRYLECATKALNWILNAQHPVSGGFTGADVFAITYNDDVMSDALTILRDISNGSGAYSVFPSETQKKAKSAYEKGIECILKTQITVTLKNGTKLLTAWCQQHYHDNLQPRWPREFEPPSICSTESFKVLKLLMADPNPTEAMKKAVKAGVEFFDRDDVRIHDKKVKDVPLSKPIYWENVKRTDTKERIMVDEKGNRDLWARFYALDSSFDVVKDARKPIQGTYPEVLSPIWCDRGCKYVENYMDLIQ